MSHVTKFKHAGMLRVFVVAALVLLFAAAGVGAVSADNGATLTMPSGESQVFSTVMDAVNAWNDKTAIGAYTIDIEEGTYDEYGILIKKKTDGGITQKSLVIRAKDSKIVTFRLPAEPLSGTTAGIVFGIHGGSETSTWSTTFEGITFDLSATKTDMHYDESQGKDVYTYAGYATYCLKGGSNQPDTYFDVDTGRYASNVTFKACTFIGNSCKNTKGIESPSGSSPGGIYFVDCTATNPVLH